MTKQTTEQIRIFTRFIVPCCCGGKEFYLVDRPFNCTGEKFYDGKKWWDRVVALRLECCSCGKQREAKVPKETGDIRLVAKEQDNETCVDFIPKGKTETRPAPGLRCAGDGWYRCPECEKHEDEDDERDCGDK
jgi:hypothetical protein